MVSTCMLGVMGRVLLHVIVPQDLDVRSGTPRRNQACNQARMYRRTWMYSACEMGMRVRYWTRRSIFSSIGSRVVGRKYCDEVRNSLAALPVD